MNSTQKLKYIGLGIGLFILVNLLSLQFNKRWDFTQDHRFSISTPTLDVLENINQKTTIKVYLKGNLPADFQKLAKETDYFLRELASKNKNIQYYFINPKGLENDLVKKGLQPSQLTVEQEGVVSESVIFPWATINYGVKQIPINLLKSSYFESQDAQMANSIENLEYAFAEGIHKVIAKKSKKIAILKGNSELADIYQYDFLKSLKDQYFLAPFTLDSVQQNPQKTLAQLQNYDLTIITKPSKAFTEAEKFTLDQYTMNGGKSIWMLDMVKAPKDSLMQYGQVLAYQQDLNLTDFMFNYGVRIQRPLVKDLFSSKITLAVGKVGNNTQFESFLWHYNPVVKSNESHVINKNLDQVQLQFTSSIDTLNSKIKKTILLESSPFTQTQTVPSYISLKNITEPATPDNYNGGKKAFGVLVEGNLTSAYKNRIKPFKNQFLEKGNKGKMVVIADGDISTNQIHKGKPLELGLDKWNNIFYANKEFLTNTVNYLLDDDGLIQLRSKKVILAHINKPKAYQEKQKWQWINILIPLIIIAIIALLNTSIRKRKYGK